MRSLAYKVNSPYIQITDTQQQIPNTSPKQSGISPRSASNKIQTNKFEKSQKTLQTNYFKVSSYLATPKRQDFAMPQIPLSRPISPRIVPVKTESFETVEVLNEENPLEQNLMILRRRNLAAYAQLSKSLAFPAGIAQHMSHMAYTSVLKSNVNSHRGSSTNIKAVIKESNSPYSKPLETPLIKSSSKVSLANYIPHQRNTENLTSSQSFEVTK